VNVGIDLFCELVLDIKLCVLMFLLLECLCNMLIAQNGVMLQSYWQFRVDLHYVKFRFYKSFNSIFHKAGRVRNELVTLHLVSAYCNSICYMSLRALTCFLLKSEVYNILCSVLYRMYRVAQKSKPLSRIIIKSY